MNRHLSTKPQTSRISFDKKYLFNREWLVTNGLGGYASGTLSGAATRRYHGMLVSALPAPLGRMMMLGGLIEAIRAGNGKCFSMYNEETSSEQSGAEYISDFKLEMGLPVWVYEAGGIVLEKRIVMPYRQNTVHISYRILSGEGPVKLDLRPAMNFRPHDAPVSSPPAGSYVLTVDSDRYEFSAGENLPQLRMMVYGQDSSFTYSRKNIRLNILRPEEGNLSEGKGDLWSGGYFTVELSAGHSATLVASTERWDTILTLRPTEVNRTESRRRSLLLEAASLRAGDETGKKLVLAADQFIITPAWRREDMAKSLATGLELRTVIAGYHWFTDWGRDTMIGLEGLTLISGRYSEARSILLTFAGYIQDGLIPNVFPEGRKKGYYNTADASLWFFHAVDRYLAYTNDYAFLENIMPKLSGIIDSHLKGTRYGISVDQHDNLLRQGEEGLQLTWMDAKVDGRVITPRSGKAVEINALWYNALKLMEEWAEKKYNKKAASRFGEIAGYAMDSFNKRFWYKEGDYLYDVVDGMNGDDASCRPNQIMAMSLRFPVLKEMYWHRVIETVQTKLLTPVGLRTLEPGHPDYKGEYYGDIKQRDASYHQGTVWAWLIGPFIDAWLKCYPDDKKGGHSLLEGFVQHLDEACVGSISEIFDAEQPFTPRGCIAQAWSVAEVLRAWVNTL